MGKKRNPPGKQARPSANRNAKGLADRTIVLLLALFAFVLYANTLGHGYVGDDNLAISLNPNVQQGIPGILNIFTQPYRENCFGGCLYRPLTLTMFALEWMVAPKNPFIGHLMNVLWYAATIGLLFLAIKRLMPERNNGFALMACILFAAHPIHTEVVANIKSRDEILSLFFVLLSLHQYAGWHKTKQWKSILFAGLAFLAALLSKEGAITSIVVFPFIGWLFFQKSFGSSLKTSLWVIFPLGLFFLLRWNALTGLTAPPIHMLDNQLVEAKGTERLGTAFFILSKYFFLLLFPFRLVSDYSYNVFPLRSLGSLASLIGVVLYVTMGIYAVLALIKRQTGGFFAMAFLISISLYSQVVIIIGTIMGERLVYTPSLWFVLAATTAVTALLNKDGNTFSSALSWQQTSTLQRIILVGFTGIILWFSIKTFLRNKDWASDYQLMKTDVEKSPNSVRLNDGYADEIYKSLGQGAVTPDELAKGLALSEQYSKKSIAIHPGISSYTNMANISMLRKHYPEALTYYLKIVDISADRGIAERNVASFLMYWAKEESEKNHNPAHALELLKQALQYNPNDGETWHGMGIIKYSLGNLTEAQSDLEKAYSLSPDNAAIKSDLAKFYLSQGMSDKANALQ